MNAAALRERLAADGIHLDVEGDRLLYEGPPDALTAAVLDELRAAAEELRGLLRAEGERSAYSVLRIAEGGVPDTQYGIRTTQALREHEQGHEQGVRSADCGVPDTEYALRNTPHALLPALVEKVGGMQQYWQRHAAEWSDAEYERRREMLLYYLDQMDAALQRLGHSLGQYGWAVTAGGVWHRLSEPAAPAPGPAARADADREALRAEIADLPVEDQLVILGYLQCRRCARWLLAKECEPDAEAQPRCIDRADCREAAALRAGTARPLAAPPPPPAELHLDL